MLSRISLNYSAWRDATSCHARVNLYFYGKKYYFPCIYCMAPQVYTRLESEIINEWYHTSRLS